MNKRHIVLLILIGVVALLLIIKSARARKAQKMASPPPGKGDNEQSSYKSNRDRMNDCQSSGGQIVFGNQYPGGWTCMSDKRKKSNKNNLTE